MPLTTIVVVDDDEDFRLAVCTLLRTRAPMVSVVGDAADGEEALVVVRRERPTVVVTDLIMPRLDGIGLTRRIRQELPDTRIIMMSSHTEDVYRFLAADGGADVFLNKRSLATSLLPAIHGIRFRPPLGSESSGTTTLGDLLYADTTKTPVLEREWVGLVQSIAGGDQQALRALYERADGIVFTLIARITEDRGIAEELTVDVFRDVWRTASEYDPAGDSVVRWIMGQARSRAVARAGFEGGNTRLGHRGTGLPSTAVSSSPSASSSPSEDLADDVLRPSASLWERLPRRIRGEAGSVPASHVPTEAAWAEAGPGIACKLLATDTEKHRVSLLVRLAPGAAYPPHRHAGVEELYLLHGVLMIDGRTLYPGDYNRAEAGSGDERVWSETGCTCVLLTSTQDVLH